MKRKKIRESVLLEWDKPDRNCRIYTKESFVKAINHPKFEELGGIPITFNDTSKIQTTIDPKTIVGYAKDINLDENTMVVEMEESMLNLFKSPERQFSIRGIGKINSDKTIDIQKLISFNIVAPPERGRKI